MDPSWQPPEGFCDHSPIGGPSEENYFCTADMGLVQADTTAITAGWAETMGIVQQALSGAGAWSWAFFSSWAPPATAEPLAPLLRGLAPSDDDARPSDSTLA